MLLRIGVEVRTGLIEVGETQSLLIQKVDGRVGIPERTSEGSRNTNLERKRWRRRNSFSDGLLQGFLVGLTRLCKTVITDIVEDLEHGGVQRTDRVTEGGQCNRRRKRNQAITGKTTRIRQTL